MKVEITLKQAELFEILLIQNRDSAKLQKITGCQYIESIENINIIRKNVLDAYNNNNNR